MNVFRWIAFCIFLFVFVQAQIPGDSIDLMVVELVGDAAFVTWVLIGMAFGTLFAGETAETTTESKMGPRERTRKLSWDEVQVMEDDLQRIQSSISNINTDEEVENIQKRVENLKKRL